MSGGRAAAPGAAGWAEATQSRSGGCQGRQRPGEQSCNASSLPASCRQPPQREGRGAVGGPQRCSRGGRLGLAPPAWDMRVGCPCPVGSGRCDSALGQVGSEHASAVRDGGPPGGLQPLRNLPGGSWGWLWVLMEAAGSWTSSGPAPSWPRLLISHRPSAVPFGEDGNPPLRAHLPRHGQGLPSQEEALVHPSTPSSSKTL